MLRILMLSQLMCTVLPHSYGHYPTIVLNFSYCILCMTSIGRKIYTSTHSVQLNNQPHTFIELNSLAYCSGTMLLGATILKSLNCSYFSIFFFNF